MQGIAVGIVDITVRQLFTDRLQFIAGGKECHARAAGNHDLADTERGYQAQVRRGQPRPLREYLITDGYIFSGLPDVITGTGVGADPDNIAVAFGPFLDHDRIGAYR